MNYLGQLFLRKSTIGYGCLVLLGSVSAAGVAELELKHQVFSKGIGQFTEKIREGISSSSGTTSSQGQAITATQVFGPFVIAGQAVKSVAKTVGPFIIGTYEILKTLKTNITDGGKGIKSFFKSLMEPEIFKLIFKNIHNKIGQLLLFLVIGADGARDEFATLFGASKKDKTLQAAKLLLGLGSEKNKNFRAKPEVFHFLFLSGLDNPKKVTGKFDRLSESIDKLLDKLKSQNGGSESGGGNGGSGDSNGEDSKYVYELDVQTTKEYLDTTEGLPESLYKLVGAAEVFSKIKEGHDYTGKAKTGVSVAGNFGPLFTG